jgi:transcriptional regulator PpsR
MLATVRASGQPATAAVRLRQGAEVTVSAALFRAASSTMIFCRLSPKTGESDRIDFAQEALPALFRDGGDAIVLTDSRGRIQRANEAFLSLAGVALEDSLRGESLDTYLGRAGVDLAVMLAKAGEHGRMKLYATTLRGRFGASCPVEISVTHLAETMPPGFAFVIRDTSRAAGTRSQMQAVSRESVEHVMDLVGSAPLKELVRSTTDVVEKMCIEAALELTGNNRASAAEMLGLSRQSLYVKLRKFGMVRPDEVE